ncbi:MAG TPA: hypothetical protein VEZ20_10485 [Allosphingosinicella sp.]|jgi:hypothetical protein|nr:hypothetical protein [Allosphingosinicella sp.]
MISIRWAALLACSAVLAVPPARAQGAEPPPEAPVAADPDIEVTGARPDRPDVPPATGSRIAREPLLTFGTIASTGVAGLTPGSGMDPFAGGTRMVSETLCRSDNARLSSGAACRLFPIQQRMTAGDLEGARNALDRFESDATASDEEKYVAAALRYQIAAAAGVPLDREDALRAMLATAAMPAAARAPALRTLVSLALRRGDRAAAAGSLAELLALVPEDTRSLVNLAALRAEAGERAEAAALIGRAIEILRARGEPVPAEWLSFAAAAPAR